MVSIPEWVPPLPSEARPGEALAYVAFLLLIDLPLLVVLFRKTFGGWRGWLRDKMYDATPGWVSFLRGELGKDHAAEWRLRWFSFKVVLLLFATHLLLGRILVPVFERFLVPLLRSLLEP